MIERQQTTMKTEDSMVAISSQLIDKVAFSSLFRTSELVEVPKSRGTRLKLTWG